jgi:hypothetical protein
MEWRLSEIGESNLSFVAIKRKDLGYGWGQEKILFHFRKSDVFGSGKVWFYLEDTRSAVAVSKALIFLHDSICPLCRQE